MMMKLKSSSLHHWVRLSDYRGRARFADPDLNVWITLPPRKTHTVKGVRVAYERPQPPLDATLAVKVASGPTIYLRLVKEHEAELVPIDRWRLERLSRRAA